MKRTLQLICLALIGLMGCKSGQPNRETVAETGLYKVGILYPNEEGKTFDAEYYENKHMPMMAGLLGKNLKFYEIDKGIAGRTPNDKIPFVAIGYFYCYDIAEYKKVVGQNITVVLDDLKKFTNIQPTIQISEIRKLKRGT